MNSERLNAIVSQLSPPLNEYLTRQLFEEYSSCERRYIQRDWEPAELDGGQFCEVAARIWYHQDSGNLNLKKNFDDCGSYIENEQVTHLIQIRHNALHVIKVLRTVYKFRSQRGAVHISPNYSPNHMDARLILENVRWVMNETLRVFWNSDREKVAALIRELLQFEVPAIGKYGKHILVQRTDLTTEEELILLLHYSGDAGFSRTELGKYCQSAPSSITNCLSKLKSKTHRQIIEITKGQYRLTELGSKRVREDLTDKMIIN